MIRATLWGMTSAAVLLLVMALGPAMGHGQASSCAALEAELLAWCAEHPDAGTQPFDDLCDWNAAIAMCNCLGLDCYEEPE